MPVGLPIAIVALPAAYPAALIRWLLLLLCLLTCGCGVRGAPTASTTTTPSISESNVSETVNLTVTHSPIVTPSNLSLSASATVVLTLTENNTSTSQTVTASNEWSSATVSHTMTLSTSEDVSRTSTYTVRTFSRSANSLSSMATETKTYSFTGTITDTQSGVVTTTETATDTHTLSMSVSQRTKSPSPTSSPTPTASSSRTPSRSASPSRSVSLTPPHTETFQRTLTRMSPTRETRTRTSSASASRTPTNTTSGPTHPRTPSPTLSATPSHTGTASPSTTSSPTVSAVVRSVSTSVSISRSSSITTSRSTSLSNSPSMSVSSSATRKTLGFNSSSVSINPTASVLPPYTVPAAVYRSSAVVERMVFLARVQSFYNDPSLFFGASTFAIELFRALKTAAVHRGMDPATELYFLTDSVAAQGSVLQLVACVVDGSVFAGDGSRGTSAYYNVSVCKNDNVGPACTTKGSAASCKAAGVSYCQCGTGWAAYPPTSLIRNLSTIPGYPEPSTVAPTTAMPPMVVSSTTAPAPFVSTTTALSTVVQSSTAPPFTSVPPSSTTTTALSTPPGSSTPTPPPPTTTQAPNSTHAPLDMLDASPDVVEYASDHDSAANSRDEPHGRANSFRRAHNKVQAISLLQLQFVYRLDLAPAFRPATVDDIAAAYRLLRVLTEDVLLQQPPSAFAQQFLLDPRRVNFTTNSLFPPDPVVPVPIVQTSTAFLPVAAALVFPMALLVLVAYRGYKYVRWKLTVGRFDVVPRRTVEDGSADGGDGGGRDVVGDDAEMVQRLGTGAWVRQRQPQQQLPIIPSSPSVVRRVDMDANTSGVDGALRFDPLEDARLAAQQRGKKRLDDDDDDGGDDGTERRSDDDAEGGAPVVAQHRFMGGSGASPSGARRGGNRLTKDACLRSSLACARALQQVLDDDHTSLGTATAATSLPKAQPTSGSAALGPSKLGGGGGGGGGGLVDTNRPPLVPAATVTAALVQPRALSGDARADRMQPPDSKATPDDKGDVYSDASGGEEDYDEEEEEEEEGEEDEDEEDEEGLR